MYKCTDCGCEYEIKPEYCDCGNNIFEEVFLQPKPEIKKQPQRDVEFNEIPKTKPKKQIDYLGWIIFSICIILSILSILFLGNSALENSENTAQEQKTVLQPNKNIPSVDTFWKTSKIELPKQIETQQLPKVNKIETTKPKTVNAPITKPVTVKKQTTVKQTNTQKPAKQQSQQQVTPKVNVQKYIPKQTASQPKTQATTIQSTVKPTNTVNNTALQQELSAYKIALRKRIVSKMALEQVVGDGDCAVTFKINSSGKLIDRKFSKQSSNTTLNDVVYSAMMQNPSYQSPPSAYKNETLTLSVKMHGGYFEIDLR